MDPELRARRIVNISQYADVDFCKSFWFLAESGKICLATCKSYVSLAPWCSLFCHHLHLFVRGDAETSKDGLPSIGGKQSNINTS